MPASHAQLLACRPGTERKDGLQFRTPQAACPVSFSRLFCNVSCTQSFRCLISTVRHPIDWHTCSREGYPHLWEATRLKPFLHLPPVCGNSRMSGVDCELGRLHGTAQPRQNNKHLHPVQSSQTPPSGCLGPLSTTILRFNFCSRSKRNTGHSLRTGCVGWKEHQLLYIQPATTRIPIDTRSSLVNKKTAEPRG